MPLEGTEGRVHRTSPPQLCAAIPRRTWIYCGPSPFAAVLVWSELRPVLRPDDALRGIGANRIDAVTRDAGPRLIPAGLVISTEIVSAAVLPSELCTSTVTSWTPSVASPDCQVQRQPGPLPMRAIDRHDPSSMRHLADRTPFSSQAFARTSTRPRTSWSDCVASTMKVRSAGDVIMTNGQLPTGLNFQLTTPRSRLVIEKSTGPSSV
jgi:hypothetical protein